MSESVNDIFKRAQEQRAREESDPNRPLGGAESNVMRMLPDMSRTIEDIEQKIRERKVSDEEADKIHQAILAFNSAVGHTFRE